MSSWECITCPDHTGNRWRRRVNPESRLAGSLLLAHPQRIWSTRHGLHLGGVVHLLASHSCFAAEGADTGIALVKRAGRIQTHLSWDPTSSFELLLLPGWGQSKYSDFLSRDMNGLVQKGGRH